MGGLLRSGARPLRQRAFRAAGPDRDRWLLASARLVYEGDGFRLTSASAWFQRIDRSVIDYSTFIPSSFGAPVVKGLPGYLAYSEMQNKQTAVSQELRAQSTSPDARLGWLFGAYLGSARQGRSRRSTIPRPRPWPGRPSASPSLG